MATTTAEDRQAEQDALASRMSGRPTDTYRRGMLIVAARSAATAAIEMCQMYDSEFSTPGRAALAAWRRREYEQVNDIVRTALGEIRRARKTQPPPIGIAYSEDALIDTIQTPSPLTDEQIDSARPVAHAARMEED